ncbi:uncharacterized protein GGS22DRAFT_54345 [Annulohypoxylon maeteangense]|uniref:uncharacterized protein n=1 Tax=Annulohypoxylon maeteangense TaxID=1927788 RepID=UPI002007D215|nr:uncharacterized protein GGS22DRAFT_54345 [Annulohypoxylon maeteangense]KAI0882082.1 hypothetical protein GGS22DRAFT_54345 [Annulohypoxylon maeteangense]
MAAENSHQLFKLTTSQAQVVQSALQQWSKVKLINPDLIPDLLTTIQIIEDDQGFPWQKFAKYAFRLAILSLIIGIFSIIFDEVLPKLIRAFLDLSIALRLVITAGVAIMVHTWGYQRSLIKPEELYLNESIHCLGAFIFALGAIQLGSYLECDDEDENRDRLNWIILGLSSTYNLVAVMVVSNFILSCGMVFLGLWVGCLRQYLGSRYPIRFALLGVAIICAAYPMRLFQCTAELWSATRTWGLLYLFNSLWILSLIDSFLEYFIDNSYKKQESGQVLSWFLTFLSAAGLSLGHGLQFRDSTTHGFGLVYLSINLCTKFFELFWDAWYKSVFFIVLALSLAVLGRYAEYVNIQHTNDAYVA